ncbi:hypothetical protein [Salipiger bermudensis]|uniref:hypothetical protein n=1 Tax=Salipiger bermudensis TaxID=344736 RepID=UPI001CD6F411|nr:hypothetical protein [Salipiger bermudensis]MCA0961173.1 hypothetical protein [Salipiger bermudensis]
MDELTQSQKTHLETLKSAGKATAIPAVVGAKLVEKGFAVRAPGEAVCTRGYGSFKAA